MFIVHGWVLDAIRLIFAAIDGIIYELLAAVVAIFYNVASAQLISGTIMHDFFSRIQLVLGIIVMFKVATSLFMGIMNPESIGDKKNGFGSVIKRVIIVLIMIVLIVPLDIPGVDMDDIGDEGQTSWNARLNANGIAFGTLFELQARLLKQNTIAKLVLGVDGSDSTTAESGLESGQALSRIVFKSFFVIAEYEGEPICEASSGSNLEKAYDLYLDDDSTAGELLSIVNYTCEDGDGTVMSIFDAVDFLDLFDSGNFYAFSYSFLFSTVVGIFCVIVMISYTVDAAIRLVKLTILYLIAPIPILSYIDPKTEKNFQNWLKVVGSTYLDLFIRLAIVYIIIFLIREVDSTLFNGTNDFIAVEDGVIGTFSKVFIILGLLMFAREAPKFITDTLGLKQTSGLFGGLTSLIGGVSSTVQGFKASQDAIRRNAPGDEKKLSSRFKSAAAGLVNGLDASGTAYRDYAGAKDHKFRSALDKINQQNAIRRANAAEGVTFGQSLMAQARQDFTGDSRYDMLKRAKADHDRQTKMAEAQLEKQKQQLKPTQQKLSSIEKALSAAQDTVKKKGAQTTLSNYSFTDANGNARSIDYSGNLKLLEQAMEAGKRDPNGIYRIKDANGVTHELLADSFGKLYADAVDASANQYINGTAKFAGGAAMSNAEHKLLLDEAIQAAGGSTIAEFKSAKTSISDTVTNAEKAIRQQEEDIFNSKNGPVTVNGQTIKDASGNDLTYGSIDAEIAREEKALRGSDGRRGGKQA
jgi:hypothetical protein